MQYKALITLESNPRHVLSTRQFIQRINFTCSRNRFFYIFFKKKNLYVIYVGKTVILVKCSFRHNTSSARSKIGGMVEVRQYNHFEAFEPHSYTKRDVFFIKTSPFAER